jgi:hypothetical protein
MLEENDVTIIDQNIAWYTREIETGKQLLLTCLPEDKDIIEECMRGANIIVLSLNMYKTSLSRLRWLHPDLLLKHHSEE